MSDDRKRCTIAAVTVGLLMAGVFGCGDVEVGTLANSESPSEEVSQTAKVTPEFAIRGLDEVPEEMMLEELGLSIGEIRLEPARGDEGFVYATSKPFSMTFDLADGEDVLRGETVEFPETGRFLVSIRLEPREEEEIQDLDDMLYAGSLGIRGQVRSDYVVSQTEEEERRELLEDEDEEYDGNPLPLPAERPSYDEDMWKPFTLTSNRVVAYTFSDVELTPGEQALTFEFDLQDWAHDAAAPIVDAVHSTETEGEEVVDVGREIDSATSEPEALLGTGSVSTVAY